ncbi:MAG: YARHG domain-containing protein [Candidatus Competibacteraceae bacterium]
MEFTEQLIDGQYQVELSFHWTDWEPAQDLAFTIGPGRPTLETPSLIDGCPAHGEVFDSDFDLATLDVAALKERTKTLSKEKLRVCRNAIFAHHGRNFTDPELNRFFYGARDLLIHAGANSRDSAVFAKNPHFSPAMLTEPETAYVKAIQQLERER